MGVAEIQSSIDNLNSQVRGLGNLKTDYQNMNNQINQAITELSTAYNHIVNARNQLSEKYSSDVANKKVEELCRHCRFLEVKNENIKLEKGN